MTSGGRRVRSGPPPDPNSRTSERRGYTLRALPNTEYSGRPLKYPLAPLPDEESARRESEVWKWLWKQPQARAWKLAQYRYMVHDIAMYCRMFVVCERPEAKTSDRVLMLRLSDRIGLSPAGLASLGWKVAEDDSQLPVVDSEFTRRLAEKRRREAQQEREAGDDRPHVYQRRMSGNGR